ncbi:MAG: hypothetical protein F6K48_26315 [Okeania sp. SIO3H1]|nr:hypothetical protein [Okeania sp. SIO3H1]
MTRSSDTEKFSPHQHIHTLTHAEAITIFTNAIHHLVKHQKKLQGFSPCILKKIIVVCNYWVLLVPTHDFLFNPKTAYRD